MAALDIDAIIQRRLHPDQNKIQELKQASLEWEAWSDIIVKSLTNEF